MPSYLPGQEARKMSISIVLLSKWTRNPCLHGSSASQPEPVGQAFVTVTAGVALNRGSGTVSVAVTLSLELRLSSLRVKAETCWL